MKNPEFGNPIDHERDQLLKQVKECCVQLLEKGKPRSKLKQAIRNIGETVKKFNFERINSPFDMTVGRVFECDYYDPDDARTRHAVVSSSEKTPETSEWIRIQRDTYTTGRRVLDQKQLESLVIRGDEILVFEDWRGGKDSLSKPTIVIECDDYGEIEYPNPRIANTNEIKQYLKLLNILQAN